MPIISLTIKLLESTNLNTFEPLLWVSHFVPPSHLCDFQNATSYFTSYALSNLMKFEVKSIYRYKFNILRPALEFLMTTLAKQRAIVEESDIIYDSPSETVPKQLFCSNSGYFSNYNLNILRYLENINTNPLAQFLLN